MKLKNTIAILFAAAVLLPMTSCLKDQADTFEVPSSQRMQDYLANVRNVLTDKANTYGWALSYYPGSDYATCYMGVSFTGQEVTAYSQKDPEKAVKSTYTLTTDDGAVLSFDTYNSVLHYYSTASSDHYQARGGDFEFDIKSVSNNRIVLRGKRSGNYCYLDRLTEEIPAFLKKMQDAEKQLNIVAFTGEVTGGLVEGFLDGTSHTLSIGRKGAETTEMVKARYMVTSFGEGDEAKPGIHINEPLSCQGVSFEDFVYDDANGTFTSAGIAFNNVVPEGFVPYNQYLGKWTFYWYNGDRSFPVELVAFEEGSSFKMKGLSTYFEPILKYNAARGQITWNAQAVGSSGSTNVMLAGWDLLTHGGSLSWKEELGLVGIVEDNTVEKLVLKWEDNGQSDYVVDSWILWGTDANGNSTGAFEGWTMASNSYQLPYVTSMVKNVE